MGAAYMKTADLPQVIPVFPLDGALLLPNGMLPLNIFEPRYLNMIDDVMAGDRLIGMIQPSDTQANAPSPALFSVGLADTVTPASTVFAAFNHYAGPKDIAVYPYNGHEGGGTRHFLAQLAFLGQAGLS